MDSEGEQQQQPQAVTPRKPPSPFISPVLAKSLQVRLNEPCHEKTCLSGTNRAIEPQKRLEISDLESGGIVLSM